MSSLFHAFILCQVNDVKLIDICSWLIFFAKKLRVSFPFPKYIFILFDMVACLFFSLYVSESFIL